MKHLFIINPAAGGGKSLKFLPKIKRLFETRTDEYRIEITERPGHATEIAKKYSSDDSFRIYSVGGDGTLNEVVNGVAGSGSGLAIIPGGSGNDFIRNICEIRNMGDILERTVEGKEKPTDLAKVNGRYYLNVASLGFDGEVAYNTNRHKKLTGFRGKLPYILGVVETLFKYKNNFLKVSVDGKQIEMKSLLAAVANGKCYGGGMLVAPHARIDDGMLDLCLVKEMNRLKIIRFFPEFIKGHHGKIEGVSFYKGKMIEITCDGEVPLNMDGEVEMVKQAVFEVIPHGIRVVVPE